MTRVKQRQYESRVECLEIVLTLKNRADRPEQTVYTQICILQHLIRVYNVCHSSSTTLDTLTGSQIDFFHILGQVR